MRIQHNIMAMNAYRNYTNNTNALSKNLEKLSSGYRINRAGDDAAGLAISEKMRAQITGLDAAQKNVKDGISLVKTAEGAMQEVQDMLNRMVYLATQSANGTYDSEVDRANLQKEVDSLRSEIDRIADSANFNGIKLLDGSLDSSATGPLSADSAISNITSSPYTATGAASEAFEAEFITNRPAASTTQTNASFTVSFDDVALDAVASGDNKITVKIGDATLNVTFTGSSAAKTGAEIATALLTAGCTNDGTAAEQTDGQTAGVTNAETSKWDAATGTTTGGAYVKIDGNWYKMADGGAGKVTFTQVNFTGKTGEVINPDYAVSVQKNGAGDVTGTVNWQVQNPVTGVGIGTSHQAQAQVNIDFSKLKDGDQLTIGDKTYNFQIGTGSSAGTGVNIDLSTILETEADLADADKQAKAMDAIVKAMGGGGSTAWSFGNGGVNEGKGTVTLQSLSDYTDATLDIAGTTTDLRMDTEANIMAQIYSTAKQSNASTSFELDVTKIKEGDTFTIDGTTFEFTNGSTTSTKGNQAIDLSNFNIAEGIAAFNSDNVMAAVKTAITNALGTTKYATTVDGNKLTLTSNADASTAAIEEEKIAASVELPAEAYAGSALTLQIGDTADEYNQLAVNIEDMHVVSLGIGDIDITTQEGAATAVDKIKAAINSVSMTRGTLGATQNRLEHTANNLAVMEENIQDAESTIRDTDVADEMMAYTKNNILIQSAQAMLAQANAVPQGVLQLLQ